MTRMRVFIVFAFAISIGGVFAFATYNYVQNVQPKTVSMPTKQVVVAATDLQIGVEIKKDDIRLIDWPENAMPAGAIHDPNEVIGRGIVLPLVQNEPFLPMKLASKEAGAGLPPAIPQGMRAVSVRVNEVIGVAGYVLPGNRVDILATASPTDAHSDTITKVILANVQVLTSGTRMEQDQEKGKPMQVTVVTLLVYPDQAERLALASTEGKIQLALRNPLDSSAPETPGIKTANLMGLTKAPTQQRPSARLNAPAPVTTSAPATAVLPTVEVIRGDKRSSEVIK